MSAWSFERRLVSTAKRGGKHSRRAIAVRLESSRPDFGSTGSALAASGTDPDDPEDLGSSGRDVVTIWWNGSG